jgi:ABC-type oligopeptide transport system substrate-binding subunit/class 3 adenylate cyclase
VGVPREVSPPQHESAYLEALQRLVPKEFAERLRATRGKVASERRLVTILFSDVKGSTALAEGLDPEEVMEIMRDAFEILIPPIYRHEGTVARLMGDAILAFFGAPIAHEDDPERAIHAALDIVAGAREYAEQLERERGIAGFNVRVGIDTGLVVVGEVGSDLRVEYTAMGDAINLASRMEQHAPPAGILITHDTYRHVRGVFDVQPQEPLAVKGKAEPVQTYLVERAKPRAFRVGMRGVEGVETRMVGRDAELLILQNTFEDVLADAETRVVTVVGEAGVGKTRLLDEFFNWFELRPESVWYFRGQAVAATQAVPYSLWRDLFAYRFDILESDTASAALGKFREGMAGTLDPARADLVGHLVGFDFSASQSVRATLANAEFAATAMGHLVQYVRSLLSQSPMVILLEDLQWADDSSLDLVAHLVAQIPTARLLVVGAARPTLYDRRPSWGEGETAYSRLELGPLSKRASRALVGEILQKIANLPKGLRELVVEGSEGNPFYVEELIKMLIEDGVIVRGEDRWDVSLDRLAHARVPASLTAVLQARLDNLPADEKGVLQRASVVGREFWDQVVSELVSDVIARDEVVPLLGSLRAREMVYRRERSAFAGTEEYTFKHSVLRDVAYETVLLKVRQRYHGQVAAWLEAHAGERLAEYYGIIAAHYELAGEAERALEYLIEAGDRSRSLGAFREAAVDYQRALAILRESDEVGRAARMLMKLGLTYHSAFEFDQARQAFEEGFVLRQRAGEMRSKETQQVELQPASHPLRLAASQVRTIDPAHCVDMEPVTDQIFSGLVTLTPDLSVEPDVALRWDVLDGGRRYLFHLRDDVVWSDGVPVTAADFEYAWKRVLDPATGSPAADFLYDIKAAQAYNEGELPSADGVGVQAVGERTLVVELEGPTSYLPQLLTNTVAFPVPRHVVQLLGDDWTEPDRIVSNGAFRLTRWDRGRTIVLDRSPSYHGHFPGNAHRVLISTESARGELALYEEDSLDLIGHGRLLPAEEDQARQRHADEYISMPRPETFYVGFDAGRPPFDDRRVRQAFVLATDRARLADVDQRGFAFPATGGLVPPGMPGHSPRIGLPYDPERARSLLAEAGFPGGRGFPDVEWLDHNPPDRKPVLLLLQASWMENLGVRVEWTFVPWATFMERLYHSLPPHLWLMGWVPDYVDPDNFLRVAQWRHSARWRNREYDELIEGARRMLDLERRMEMYRQADRIVVEEAPVVPLTYRMRSILAKPWVRFPPQALGRWYYKDFTIEPH